MLCVTCEPLLYVAGIACRGLYLVIVDSVRSRILRVCRVCLLRMGNVAMHMTVV